MHDKKYFYYFSNSQNLLSILSGGIIQPSNCYSKYYSDINENYTDLIPLYSELPSKYSLDKYITDENVYSVCLLLDLKNLIGSVIIPGEQLYKPIKEVLSESCIFVNGFIPLDLVEKVYFFSDLELQEYEDRDYENVYKEHFKYEVISSAQELQYTVDHINLVSPPQQLHMQTEKKSALLNKIIGFFAAMQGFMENPSLSKFTPDTLSLLLNCFLRKQVEGRERITGQIQTYYPQYKELTGQLQDGKWYSVVPFILYLNITNIDLDIKTLYKGLREASFLPSIIEEDAYLLSDFLCFLTCILFLSKEDEIGTENFDKSTKEIQRRMIDCLQESKLITNQKSGLLIEYSEWFETYNHVQIGLKSIDILWTMPKHLSSLKSFFLFQNRKDYTNALTWKEEVNTLKISDKEYLMTCLFASLHTGYRSFSIQHKKKSFIHKMLLFWLPFMKIGLGNQLDSIFIENVTGSDKKRPYIIKPLEIIFSVPISSLNPNVEKTLTLATKKIFTDMDKRILKKLIKELKWEDCLFFETIIDEKCIQSKGSKQVLVTQYRPKSTERMNIPKLIYQLKNHGNEVNWAILSEKLLDALGIIVHNT